MKHIIFFLAIFGALLANAQEMDTTFVVNEQGQTLGIVHEKGSVPVMPGQQQQPQPNYVQAQPMQASPAFGYDSTAYYQSMIDRYTQSGRGMRRAGNGMMIGGGIATGVGAAMMVAGFASAVENCNDYDSYYGEYNCDADGEDAALLVAGYLAMFAGVAVFTTGAVVKIVGGTKLRRAERYEDKLNSYKMRQQYSVKMQLLPLVDPINNVYGGQLAFNF